MKKKSLAILIGLLVAIGLVSAGVIQYYGKIRQDVIVNPAVVLSKEDTICGNSEGEDPCIETENPITGGMPVTSDIYTLTSHTAVDVDIDLETAIDPDDAGITIEYYTTNTLEGTLEGTLELTKKDTTTWEPSTNPEDKIEIIYTIIGDTFEFSGVPDGYTLIYYKDKVVGLEGRLANQQPAITVTSDIESLPQDNDANNDELANYCGDPDFYKHCKGAKLWVVLTSDINNGTLTWGNWDNFYFETDLITYTKETYYIPEVLDTDEITISAGETLDFYVKTTFGVANTGTYTITTTANVISEV